MKSWRTTTWGIATILAALAAAAKAYFDNDPSTNPDWSSVGAAITAGLGLIVARDSAVSVVAHQTEALQRRDP